MNMSDAFAGSPHACDLVTRGAHVPTKLERYAGRARKYHGSGHHESSKDSREPIKYVAGMPLAAPALLHRARHRPTAGKGTTAASHGSHCRSVEREAQCPGDRGHLAAQGFQCTVARRDARARIQRTGE